MCMGRDRAGATLSGSGSDLAKVVDTVSILPHIAVLIIAQIVEFRTKRSRLKSEMVQNTEFVEVQFLGKVGKKRLSMDFAKLEKM